MCVNRKRLLPKATAALLSLRATGRQLGNIGNIFAMSYATLCHSDQKQPLVALVKP